jgi:hypothetical protein
MTRMAVITISFAPDFELCTALNRSVLENSPDTVQHQIIVPRADLKLFNSLAGPRTQIRCETDFLPRSIVRLPFSNLMINLRRPFPPVRGWIQQQIIKLAAIAASEEDVVLTVDSDIEFIQPFTAEMFLRDSVVRFFCNPNQIDERLPRHMIWHRVAHVLLGLPHVEPPYPDFISSYLAWDPKLVRQMLARVEVTTRRPWATAIGAQLHFSECVLYGVFVNEVAGALANSVVSGDPLCLSYWETTPLSLDSAADFIAKIRSSDIAVLIQSKSRTSLAYRKEILASLRAAQNAAYGLEAPAGGF